MAKKSNKQLLLEWQEFRDNTFKATPVDLNETSHEKLHRMRLLEANPEKWFSYYFPNFYKSEPATFHLKATKRVLNNAEYFEVRSWSRELAKSARTMMEVLYLCLLGKKRNILLVSNSYDNAERLLLPYKIILEANNRIINDYGEQQSLGQWESGEFVTKNGVAFRALGAGQSPRGTRKDELRPDCILIDDIDTDEECRNPDRIKNKMKWIEEALIPTRSISNPMLIVVCGNIIAKYCCVTELAKKADHHDIINIRDKQGKSTWPQKNSEEQIERVLKTISYNSAQKEYFNNPVHEGDVFKELFFDALPKLTTCDDVLIYADPATSNKDKGNASNKVVAVIGRKNNDFFIYKIWSDTMSNYNFVACLFEAYDYLKAVEVKKVYVENNSLQDPHYEQVLLPLIYSMQKDQGVFLPITPDSRKKPDKYFRIEGTLEPLNRLGHLIFNKKEENNPHMQRAVDQFLGVSPNAKIMDAPDCVEGGISLLKQRLAHKQTSYVAGFRSNRKY